MQSERERFTSERRSEIKSNERNIQKNTQQKLLCIFFGHRERERCCKWCVFGFTLCAICLFLYLLKYDKRFRVKYFWLGKFFLHQYFRVDSDYARVVLHICMALFFSSLLSIACLCCYFILFSTQNGGPKREQRHADMKKKNVLN